MKRRQFLKSTTALGMLPFLPPRGNCVVGVVQVKPGDILLTRNMGGDEANPSPGYYNHSAIISNDNWVVEAQAEPNSVIAVPIWNFFDRYPEILILRCTKDDVATRTANMTFKYLGREYAPYMSGRPLYLWKHKDNCVSLIRRIYNSVTGMSYKWRIPDDFTQTEWLQKVALKKDYDNYKPPTDRFAGMIKEWPQKPAS